MKDEWQIYFVFDEVTSKFPEIYSRVDLLVAEMRPVYFLFTFFILWVLILYVFSS